MVGHGQEVPCPQSGIRGADGSYSKLSVRLCWQDEAKNQRHLKLSSPNGSILLEVNTGQGQLYQNRSTDGKPFAIAPDVEWLWSPDSRAVIITTFVVNPTPVIAAVSFIDQTPKIPDVMERIQKDFAARHPKLPCARDANVGGLTWLRDSTEAVLVAEVPASPRCEKADGYFEAYVISIPEGKIVKHYSMRETVARFRNALGPGLLDDIQAQREEQKEK